MSGGLDDVISAGSFGLIDGGDITGSNAADAANKAGQLQYNATMAGIEAQKEALAQQRKDLSPFRNMSNQAALNKFYGMAVGRPNYSYNPNTDPLLNNALNRTTRAVMDNQAARGKLGSGSTLTSLMEAMAPQYMQREQQVFDQRYNTNNQQYNQLAQMIGMSQNAAASQGAATQNATNNITSLQGQGANALASGLVGSANAQAQGINNLIGMGMNAATMAMMSDERVKEDMTVIGKDGDLNVYEFRYIGQPEKYIGYSAQEVQKVDPDAIRVNGDGYLMVTGKYLPKRVA